MDSTIIYSIPLQSLIEKITEALFQKLSSEQMTKKKDQLLTRQETAKMLQISLPTLNIWTKNGIINAKRINSRVRYLSSDVDLALQNYNKYGRSP
jgi:hypothetical protein